LIFFLTWELDGGFLVVWLGTDACPHS